jgi:tetratricopeptide (TPR) repeat protein
VRGHKAWALLARILLSRSPLDRRALAAELFFDADDPLGALRWSLAALRKALGRSTLFAGDPLAADLPQDIELDVRMIRNRGFDAECAGTLLQGIELRNAQEFTTWLLVEREGVAANLAARIRDEVIGSIAVSEVDRAVRLSELLVHRAPFDESAHILLARSLVAAGRAEAALDHVEATESVFLAEFGERPSAALRSAARRTTAAPPAGVSPAAYARSLLDAGKAALSAGAADAGIDCLRRAAQEAEGSTDKHLFATASLELGSALVHAVRGFDDEGSVALRSAAEVAEPAGYDSIASAAWRELGHVESLAGRRPTADEYLERALNHADDDNSLAGAHAERGFNLVDWGKIDDGLSAFEVALDHARRAGNRRREIWCLGLAPRGLMLADRLPAAKASLAKCLELIDTERWVAFRPWPESLLYEVRLRQRESPAAMRSGLEETFALSCQIGDPCWEGTAARAVALTFLAEGNPEQALVWLADGLKRIGRITDTYVGMVVEILASYAEVNFRTGQRSEADALLRKLLAMSARAHMDVHLARASDLIAESRNHPR